MIHVYSGPGINLHWTGITEMIGTMNISLLKLNIKAPSGACSLFYPKPGNLYLLSKINLNILPNAYQSELFSLKRIIAVPILISSFALLLLLAFATLNISSDISEMQSQLTSSMQLLQERLEEKRQLVDAVDESRQEMKVIGDLRNSIATALASFEMQSQKINGDLEISMDAVPDTVNLTNINHNGDSFILNGIATSEEEVLSFLSELNASGRFSHIKIANINSTGDEEVTFNAILSIRS